jgi:hypothetical protein
MPARRWVLKNSPHLLYLDALHAVYPDAQFVQMHRDPIEVLSSNCSLALFLRQMNCDDVDPHEVGESILQLISDYIDGVMRFRTAHTARPWIDVAFTDFVAEPLAETQRIYDAAGFTMTPIARDRMRQWVQENPRDKRGRHVHDLAPFGLDVDRVREQFTDYYEAFSAPLASGV